MKPGNSAKVPPVVWAVAICVVALIVLISDLLYHHKNIPKEAFLTERLERIEDNGLLVIGNSLAMAALPLDEELDHLARGRGMEIEFVRFSIRGNGREKFKSLISEIGGYSPRWIFLQAEPFFLSKLKDLPGVTDSALRLKEDLDGLTKDILFMGASIAGFSWGDMEFTLPPYQSDHQLELTKTTSIEDIEDNLEIYEVGEAEFPDYIEEFIVEAKSRGIRVFIVEINRSKVANKNLGKDFRLKLDETLRAVSRRYSIPLWQFRGDLSVMYYSDRAHLNYKGRSVFSDWFLSEIAKEY